MPDNAVSVFDEDIQAALKNDGKDGVMTITDYQKYLRTNPKTKPQWLKTKGAKEEAAGYANEILKTFGLIG
jgi:kynurenine formamidase